MNKNNCLRSIAWSICIVCCTSIGANAQILNLYDAVNKAAINYPAIQQRQAEVAAGKAHVTTVKNNRLPALILQDQFDVGTANTEQGAYFSMGLVPSTPGGSPTAPANYNPNPVNLAISSLQWEFYNFGYYKAQAKQAGAQLAVNEANLGSDKYMLTENIISLYLDWLKKYRILQIQEENMGRARIILTAIRATVLSGLKPGVDSSTASAAYSDARLAYLHALDDYNYDRISIASYTGVTANNLMPDTTFISAAILQSPTAMEPADSVPAAHPLLNVYEKQYEQQLADNNTISKKYLPRVSLNGTTWVRNSGISHTGAYPEDVFDGVPYSKYNYLVGAVLTYNLFDLNHRQRRSIEPHHLWRQRARRKEGHSPIQL